MKGERQMVNFKYIKLPAMRFIGIDTWRTKEEWLDMWIRRNEFLPKLEEGMKEQISSVMPWVCSFMHHDDGEVDATNRYLIGHFFEPDTLVSPGYDYYEFKPQTAAYAVFEEACFEDLFLRYEVTRDKILEDGIGIPYPISYWHAEVYFDKTPDEELFNCGVLFSCNK